MTNETDPSYGPTEAECWEEFWKIFAKGIAEANARGVPYKDGSLPSAGAVDRTPQSTTSDTAPTEATDYSHQNSSR
ncbi:hypothetical protein [Streptomyces sp. NBC_01760]|uniref:hypothetical protein n=1 Tax=Streptomyces sp. NBC_01760 TaxID=2975931 RepID=UPI002DD8661F|nr:hypothetical protein [Streptomyces sp. NBC_01760]WSC72210.1 hypothetical protein OG807_29090 [Streptomyces sp. NBC_01760]